MSTITTIITAYRRPQNIQPLVDAIRRQSVLSTAIWCWANDPNEKMKVALAKAELDRVVTSSDNARFHGRFALALLARTEFVAIFDDDSIPGKNWFSHCLDTMVHTPGILGTAGVVLHEAGYVKRTMHGWQRPNDNTVEVDLVGQAWFLRTEWVKHLFSGPPVTGANGEDIELAARAWRLAGIRSYCPPHPAGDRSRWGSTRGLELGVDSVAASLTRADHEAQRDEIVRSEMAAGWLPLFCRPLAPRAEAVAPLAERADYVAVFARIPAPSAGLPSRALASPATPSNPQSAMRDPQLQPVPSSPPPLFSSSSSHGARDAASPPLTLIYGDDGAQASIVESGAAHSSYYLFITEANALEGELPAGRYQAIHLGEWLGYQTEPLAVLRRAREALAPGGRITAMFLNARHHAVVGSLFAGEWDPRAAVPAERRGYTGQVTAGTTMEAMRGRVENALPLELEDRRPTAQAPRPSDQGRLTNDHGPTRIFTPREVEKLFFRAGYKLVELTPEPSEDLARWREAGSPGEIKIGAMHIAGLSRADAEQFHAARYCVVAEAEGRGADEEGRGAEGRRGERQGHRYRLPRPKTKDRRPTASK
jgi:hypothetical protein